jgi:hypothetical protein
MIGLRQDAANSSSETAADNSSATEHVHLCPTKPSYVPRYERAQQQQQQLKQQHNMLHSNQGQKTAVPVPPAKHAAQASRYIGQPLFKLPDPFALDK